MKIMLVDDESTVRQTIAVMLESNDFKVEKFERSEDALQVLDEGDGAFDCIILDYSMPVTNGWQALQRIRHMKITTPVVLCTGLIPPQPNENDFEPDAILAKPFRMAQLLDTIQEVTKKTRPES